MGLMNSPTRIPSPRALLTLLVLSQFVVLGASQISQGILAGLLTPLGRLAIGHERLLISIGIVDLGTILTGFVSGILTIVLGSWVTLFTLRFTWRWISRALPKDEDVRPS
jgi:hypothetical protein